LAFALQKLLSLEVIILHSSFARMDNPKPELRVVFKQRNAGGYPFFHIDSEFSEFSCTTCHTGGPQLP